MLPDFAYKQDAIFQYIFENFHQHARITG